MTVTKFELAIPLLFIAVIFIIFIVTLPTGYAQSRVDIELLLDQGAEQLLLSQYENAISYYDQVLQIDPTNLEALNNKGAALVGLEKYEEAISSFNQILQIDPTNVEAIKNREAVINKIGLISTKDSKYYAYVQIQRRNSLGNLVAFIESDTVSYFRSSMTDEFLNSFPVKETLVRNDETFELREFTKMLTDIEKAEHFVSKTKLFDPNDKSIIFFSALHHGYTFESGDTITISWKIMRSISR